MTFVRFGSFIFRVSPSGPACKHVAIPTPHYAPVYLAPYLPGLSTLKNLMLSGEETLSGSTLVLYAGPDTEPYLPEMKQRQVLVYSRVVQEKCTNKLRFFSKKFNV